MTRPRAAKIAAIAVVGALAAAAVVGAAAAGAALFVSSRREVTTSSSEALRLYRAARENEYKLYVREATTGYASALEHDPRFFMAKVRLAFLLAGRDRERAASLLAAAAKSRDDVTPRERLSWDFVDASVRKDRDAAARAVDAFLALYPDDPEGYQQKAAILERSGKREEAIGLYERLLEVNPNFAIAYNFLGYFLMARGEWDRSEEYFKRYRFLAPDQANPYDSLGELYIATGRWDDAEASLRKAVEVKADFFAAHGHLGTLAVARGEWGEAARHYARAAELVPGGKGSVDFRLAEVLSTIHAGDRAAAHRLLDTWGTSLPVGAGPRDAVELRVVRAILLVSEERIPEAEREVALTAPVASSPGTPDDGLAAWEYVHGSLRAAIALRCGRGTDSDVAAVRRPWPPDRESMSGISYFPGKETFRVFLAESLAAAGRRGEALEVVGEILAGSPRCRPAIEARSRLTGEASAALTLAAPGASDARNAPAR